ncbi:hypothetical protein NE237_019850 [Protea cynaroides]|uniref:J domain-containing protein n=1 Tax=Protea cynaroides TaxID=273540 RepID=A0A9Q0H643_9MAGN|nr:hypothetical protein NE237_019850 [Protea cynaroides]
MATKNKAGGEKQEAIRLKSRARGGEKQEAVRLQSMAEEKYKQSKLKPVLKYAKSAQHLHPQLRRILSFDLGMDKYKKLDLLLHPNKNTFVASEDALKSVGEAFQLLSDKIRHKDYDLKLRIALQSQATATATAISSSVDTFWTAYTTCRLFH